MDEGNLDLSIIADVVCQDGPCGRTTRLAIYPAERRVKHLAVLLPGERNERLIKFELVESATFGETRLRCTRAELTGMDVLNWQEYTQAGEMAAVDPTSGFMMTPDASGEQAVGPDLMPTPQPRVPRGEAALYRDPQLKSGDGKHVGILHGFRVERETGAVLRALVQRGQLSSDDFVLLPLPDIDHIEANIVYVTLDAAGVAGLPATPEGWRPAKAS